MFNNYFGIFFFYPQLYSKRMLGNIYQDKGVNKWQVRIFNDIISE